MCEDKPVVKTSYVDEEECEVVTREECAPVTREECSQVVDKVPHQSSKEVRKCVLDTVQLYFFLCILKVCNTRYVEDCVPFSKNIPKKISKKQCLTKYVLKCGAH